MDAFASRYPTVFHLSAAGSWPSLSKLGLLSVKKIADQCGVAGAQREQLLKKQRLDCIHLESFVIRDQRPLRMHLLPRVLEGSGLSTEQWIEMLNDRVYFHPTRKRLDRLLKAYADQPNLILEIETRSLLEAHAHHAEVSYLNNGAVKMPTHRRNAGSFLPFCMYEWTGKHPAEFIVRDSVPDLKDHVLRAWETAQSGQPTMLYEKVG